MAAALVLAACAMYSPAWAFDAAGEFTRGTWKLGLELSGGTEPVDWTRRLSYLALGPRVSYFLLDPLDLGSVKLAFEPGIEGWLQGYRWENHTAGAGGLKAAGRVHLLGFGPVVPYVEGLAGVGGTSLNTPEIRSNFTFVLEGGAGLSVFVVPGLAVNGGYRFQHISNGGTSRPNTGFNFNGGVVGVSWFFR